MDAEILAVNPNERRIAMKLVVAYIDSAEFEPLREELLGLGIPTLSVAQSGGALPQPAVTGKYRGETIDSNVRPKARMECVLSDDRVPIVIDAVLKREGKGAFAFVVPVEDAKPSTYVAMAAEVVEGVV